MGKCLFCQFASGEIAVPLVAESDRLIAFRDINPQAPVHILIVPRAHLETILDVDDPQLLHEIKEMAAKLAQSEGIAASGFRLVINCNADGGQEVFHLHVHLLGGRKLTWPPG